MNNSVFDVQSPEDNTTSNSCPANFNVKVPDFMSEEEARLWQKDRQKKDNHNMSKYPTVAKRKTEKRHLNHNKSKYSAITQRQTEERQKVRQEKDKKTEKTTT